MEENYEEQPIDPMDVEHGRIAQPQVNVRHLQYFSQCDFTIPLPVCGLFALYIPIQNPVDPLVRLGAGAPAPANALAPQIPQDVVGINFIMV